MGSTENAARMRNLIIVYAILVERRQENRHFETRGVYENVTLKQEFKEDVSRFIINAVHFVKIVVSFFSV
jgi:hypothetical protein